MSRQMYLWGLTLLPHLGSRLIKRLLEIMPDEKAVWCASASQLQQAEGIGPGKARDIVAVRNRLDLQSRWEKVKGDERFQVITWLDQEYPYRLHEIPDPPPVLYCRGNIELLNNRPVIAVVGRRRASPRGLSWARQLSRALAARGVTVVSGLARGIDSAAHSASLETGTTAAVLGTGIDVVYPRCNRQLYARIAQKGVVLTPFPPGTAPQRLNFPARNRIISGVSEAVLVVEAGEQSGALITAEMAKEQGRILLAVPGDPHDLGAVGPNKLIAGGAKLVASVEDIVRLMSWEKKTGFSPGDRGAVAKTSGRAVGGKERRKADKENSASGEKATGMGAGNDGFHRQLLQHLSKPRHVDELVELTGLPVSQVSGLLTRMALAGVVEELEVGVFHRVG